MLKTRKQSFPPNDVSWKKYDVKKNSLKSIRQDFFFYVELVLREWIFHLQFSSTLMKLSQTASKIEYPAFPHFQKNKYIFQYNFNPLT